MTILLPSTATTFTGRSACVFKPARTWQTSRKRPRAAVAEQHARLPDDTGNPDLQEKLMNIIRVQIGQEKVKDFVKEESEKLRQAAEEAKDEVDQLSRLTRDRSNLAFDSATADINKLADDFEEQLKASREKLEADDQEFMDWEQKTAIKRSEGTFFQNLYRIKKELPGAQAAAAVNTEMQAQEAEQRAEAVEAAVQQTPPQSAIKLYVTSALTAVLSFAVVSDALSKSPSWGQDGIYIAIVLLLGLNLLSGKSK
ncbi:TPA: hypothetical protein ACH3X2_011013 [Trebouxia sp. C0005]|nr:MAG: hypothetical protein FRX49_02779 [Trebouxia sp. A1-2]